MRRLALLAIAVALAACATTRPAAAPSAATPATAGPGQAAPAPDRSLTPMEYARLGFPALDRDWTPTDYSSVNGVLAELAKKDPLQLPRRGSPRSGPVFARMTDRATFAMLDDHALSARIRAGMAGAGLVGVGGTVQTYAAAHSSGQGTFSPELVDLFSITLVASRRTMDVVLEVAPASGDRRDYDAGLAKVRSGLAVVVGGALRSLDEGYAPADRLRLAVSLAAEAPGIIVNLTEQSQAELRAKIRRAVLDEKDEAVKSRLAALERATAAR
jgi:hypothetical protein